MRHALRTLGLALAAAAVLGAVGAQGAWGAGFTTDPPTANVHIGWTADPESPTQEITMAGHTLTCSEANFEANAESEAGTFEELTFQAHEPEEGGAAGYGGCAFLGVGVNVSMGACAIVLHAEGETDITGEACEVGSEPIEFEASVFGGLISCRVEIGAQEGLNKGEYTNKKTDNTTRGGDVTVDVNLEGIAYTASSSGGGCTAGSNTNGLYRGNYNLTGSEPLFGDMVSISV